MTIINIVVIILYLFCFVILITHIWLRLCKNREALSKLDGNRTYNYLLLFCAIIFSLGLLVAPIAIVIFPDLAIGTIKASSIDLNTTYYTIAIPSVIAIGLMLKSDINDLSKFSFFGFGAEFKSRIEKQSDKSKALYWVTKGEMELKHSNYDLAEYCFRTGRKKEDDISLTFIGLGKTLIYQSRQPDKSNGEKIHLLSNALQYCQRALEVEQEWAGLNIDASDMPDTGPIFLLRATVYKELAGLEENVSENIKHMKDDLTKSACSYNKLSEKDKVFKDFDLREIYSGKELFLMTVVSEELFADFCDQEMTKKLFPEA